MPRFNFSLKTLLLAVAVVSVACAAIRFPSPWIWSSVTFAVLLSLLFAVLSAFLTRGRRRAWWLGFALAGGLYYWTTQYEPNAAVAERLPTTGLSQQLYWRIWPQGHPNYHAGSVLEGHLVGIYYQSTSDGFSAGPFWPATNWSPPLPSSTFPFTYTTPASETESPPSTDKVDVDTETTNASADESGAAEPTPSTASATVTPDSPAETARYDAAPFDAATSNTSAASSPPPVAAANVPGAEEFVRFVHVLWSLGLALVGGVAALWIHDRPTAEVAR